MGYWQTVAHSWRRNIFLLIMTLGLLIVTVSYWLSFPTFVIGSWLDFKGVPNWLVWIIIDFCICLLFSLYFVPFHIEVAREMGGNVWRQLWRIECRFVLFATVILILFTFNMFIYYP